MRWQEYCSVFGVTDFVDVPRKNAWGEDGSIFRDIFSKAIGTYGKENLLIVMSCGISATGACQFAHEMGISAVDLGRLFLHPNYKQMVAKSLNVA
jgi:hypothetical protein